MWFGNRLYMQEVPNPEADADVSPVGWEESTGYLNGGLGVVASTSAHAVHYFSWPAILEAEGRAITDYAAGVYGSGLIYWHDPIAARSNALPQPWATPALAGHDGVPLVGDVRPVLTANPVMSQGYPAELATYTVSDESVSRSVFVPIPPGHVAWVGVHGAADAAGFVKVTPFVGATAGTPVNPTILTTATTTRVNTSVGGDGIDGLELSVDVSSLGVGETDSFTLAGMIVQVLPVGQFPATGGFISGQGHSGCSFMGKPTRLLHKVGNADRVSITAKLGEVGEWL